MSESSALPCRHIPGHASPLSAPLPGYYGEVFGSDGKRRLVLWLCLDCAGVWRHSHQLDEFQDEVEQQYGKEHARVVLYEGGTWLPVRLARTL